MKIPPSEVGGLLRVGPAGWSYADWEGVVHPRPKPRGFHPLPSLAGAFDTIEINSSYYAHPRPDRAARWAELVRDAPDFRFAAKLARCFTHEPLGDEASFAREREAFAAGIRPLGDRLGALLIQFPLAFRDTAGARRRLDRIREAFAERPLVVELRHASWYEPAALRRIESAGLSLAAIDLPDGPHHPPAQAPTPGPVGYVRLHGRNAAAWFDPRAGRDRRYDYLYGRDELEGVTRRIRDVARGSDETYVITNNHFAGKAVANALDLSHLLGAEPLPAPATLVEHYPHLRPIVRASGQQSLY
jgi:uncharacterized protein YecE (DUF72 family)